MKAKILKAYRWLKANWKAALGCVSVVLVALFTWQKNRHRRRSIALQREAIRADAGVQPLAEKAKRALDQAVKHGKKANNHQANATKVIEKLRAKEGKRMGAAEARELAERIAGKSG